MYRTIVALFTLSTLFVTTLSAQSPPAGNTQIFDGKTLDGWHGMPHFDPNKLAAMTEGERAGKLAEWKADVAKHWSVEDGDLVNDGAGAYLATDKEYGDFDLTLEFMIEAISDSGVYLKGTPQVQIWNPDDPSKRQHDGHLGSGGLWNNAKGAPGKNPSVLADNPIGQWNKMRMRQIGSRTSVWLNEKQIVDNAIMANFWDRSSPLPPQGNIQLQTHGGETRWRNLSIKELSSEEANEVLQSHEDNGFVSVFNGKDLSGWQGATDNYEVVDGAIRCKKGSGGNLLTENEYANFVARLEFRLPPGGNNGLAIRSPGNGDAAYSAMCELQVLDNDAEKYADLDPRQYHGSAYGISPAKRGYLRPSGEWNFQEVTVDGSTIKVELNGAVILDTDVNKVTEYMANSPHPGKSRLSGYFGFAGHNDPVEFRNVSIRTLPGSPEL